MAQESINRPMGIRIPDDLRKQLKVKATKNHRTLGSEIINRLEQSIVAEEKKESING